MTPKRKTRRIQLANYAVFAALIGLTVAAIHWHRRIGAPAPARSSERTDRLYAKDWARQAKHAREIREAAAYDPDNVWLTVTPSTGLSWRYDGKPVPYDLSVVGRPPQGESYVLTVSAFCYESRSVTIDSATPGQVSIVLKHKPSCERPKAWMPKGTVIQ